MSVSINQHKIGRSLNPSTVSRGFQGNGLETPQSSLAMDTRRFTASIDTTIKGHSLTSFLDHAGHGHAPVEGRPVRPQPGQEVCKFVLLWLAQLRAALSEPH